MFVFSGPAIENHCMHIIYLDCTYIHSTYYGLPTPLPHQPVVSLPGIFSESWGLHLHELNEADWLNRLTMSCLDKEASNKAICLHTVITLNAMSYMAGNIWLSTLYPIIQATYSSRPRNTTNSPNKYKLQEIWGNFKEKKKIQNISEIKLSLIKLWFSYQYIQANWVWEG